VTTTRTVPTPPATRRRIPALPAVSAVFSILLGSVTAIAGLVFSFLEGGPWAYVAVPAFSAALVGWWCGGIGLLRGSRRGWVLGLVMLSALFCFGLYKILWVHEAEAYLFQSLNLVGFALHLAAPTRRWATR
jgi:hypothetical protein